MMPEQRKYRFDVPVGEYLLTGIWLPVEGKWYSLDKKISVGEEHLSFNIELPGKVTSANASTRNIPI